MHFYATKCLSTLSAMKMLGNSSRGLVRETGHKTPGESSVDITDCNYDTTHLQENPQRLG